MLTISKLKRWSINYYIDTAQAAETRCQGSGGGRMVGWRSTTRSAKPAPRCGCWPATPAPLRDVGRSRPMRQRAGGVPMPRLVARWLDDGIAPNGAHGRAFGEARRARIRSDVLRAQECVADPRAARPMMWWPRRSPTRTPPRLVEAMEYLADHAGYTRVHNPRTGEKDLVRLPGLVADRLPARDLPVRGSAPAHPRDRAQPPGPRRRAVRVDRRHLAVSRSQAAGVIYQATLRRELHRSIGRGVGAGRPVHRDGRGGRRGPRDDSGVVAALHPAARVGRQQPRRRRR